MLRRPARERGHVEPCRGRPQDSFLLSAPGVLLKAQRKFSGSADRLRAGEATLGAVAVDRHVLQRFGERVRGQRDRVGLALARVPGRPFADALEAGRCRARFGRHERRGHLALVFQAAARIERDRRRQLRVVNRRLELDAAGRAEQLRRRRQPAAFGDARFAGEDVVVLAGLGVGHRVGRRVQAPGAEVDGRRWARAGELSRRLPADACRVADGRDRGRPGTCGSCRAAEPRRRAAWR